MNSKQNSVRLAKMAMLVALSIVLVMIIHFPIFPAVAFLEYDPADIPILIGTFAFGPVAGIVLTVVTSLIQGFTVSVQSGAYGIIMHIIATTALVTVAGVIYRKHKTKKMAVIGSGGRNSGDGCRHVLCQHGDNAQIHRHAPRGHHGSDASDPAFQHSKGRHKQYSNFHPI